ncbi:patatin [Nostoc sp. 'Peltigera membranacea cyanobiont' 210A]|uniref:patatin-like phospholipase family protein n=1 Tax=Nostoc sp. 'Peltigera membranacea cyanobiont' 210A TaxID=2014529 RepID=UPI000B953433|nr:patatin-like phospholipase family protein [Nostoc sp. 'Peltigera membranacea cyanobiont' 210A]OYD97449.1 patatin [Nostoc sp. 'Peltigera membranacea cyanobiont' 210A]
MINLVNTQTVLTFDGVNDYIDFGRNDIGGVFAQGSSAFTVSGWVNPYELTNKATSYGTRNVFFARSSERYSDNFEFGISEAGSLDIYIDETVSKGIKTFGQGELTIEQWHFFAIVFNSGQLAVYLDDREYNDSLRGSSLNKATSSITLGATLHKQVYFKGQLANISVWNYPCTQAQIQTHRCGLIVGDESGLVAYWKLDEGQGTTVKNQKGKSYQGNFRGNPIWTLAEIPFATQSSNPVPFAAELSNQEDIQEEIQTETAVIPEENISPLTTSLLAATVSLVSDDENQPKEIQQTEINSEESEIIPTAIALEPHDEETKTDQTEDPVNIQQAQVLTQEESPLVSVDEKQPKEIQQTEINSEESEIIPTAIALSPHYEETKTNQTEDPVNIQQAQVLTQEESPETMNTKARPKYKILSIDGGGIRGIIPALLLSEIERRTQKPIFSLFDLITGTSSGGILALGLTKPRLSSDVSDNLPVAEYTAEDLLQLFIEYGVEIFYEPLFERLLGPLEDIFLQPKYPSESKEEIFRQYFGNALIENNLKEVFVTSYDIEQRIPIFFTNKLEKQQIESKNFQKLCGGFSLLDAALATSATPTYFAPHRVVNPHNSGIAYTLIDGGVFANNPAHLAILEAQISSKRKGQKVLNTEDILVVSLGTGSLTSVYPYKEVKNWGLLQWGRPLLNIMFDGSSEVVAGELEQVFEPSDKEAKSFYYRFQTLLDSELEEIDNTKLQNTRQLQAIAHRLISNKSQEIDELCSLLLG